MPDQRTGTLSDHDVTVLADLLLEASPAMKVRLVLREHARTGTPFEQAWLNAMQSIPRKGVEAEFWREQLHAHKAHWRDAYGQAAAHHAPVAA